MKDNDKDKIRVPPIEVDLRVDQQKWPFWIFGFSYVSAYKHQIYKILVPFLSIMGGRPKNFD